MGAMMFKSPASRLFTRPFVRGIHRWPVNSPHKWPVTWKMFSFDDVIMKHHWTWYWSSSREYAGHSTRKVNVICYMTEIDVLVQNSSNPSAIAIDLLQYCTKPSISSDTTVYPKKYAHGFVVLCFVVVMQSFILNSYEVFIHIHQGCFAGTGAIVRLPQCQWSKPDGYGKISQCITTTKHSKAKTVCIFLGIYCTSWGNLKSNQCFVGRLNIYSTPWSYDTLIAAKCQPPHTVMS